MPEYYCGICQKESSQKKHHQTHLETDIHQTKKELETLKINAMSKEERIEKYSTDNLETILDKLENSVKKNEIKKKKKTNKLYFENDEDTINSSNNSESFKYKFLEFLGKQHNLLRGASVTGDEALDDILHCLCLCYLEDKISENGRFDLANSEKSCYKGIIQRKVKDYVKYIRVSYLLEHTEQLRAEGTDAIQKCGKLLSKHPVTKLIFENNENFINCQDTQILCELLNNCKEFSQKQNIFQEVDILGIAYEYMTTKHAGNGGASKEMGQYFTERPLMGMCFQMIDKSDIEELGIDDNSTLGDEFCATLGFPLMAREFLKGHNINIQDKNIYGVEWHERLSKFAYMNAMFSMDNLKNVIRGNSFITNVTPHLDISVHNVPFGKSMTPKNIEKSYNKFLEENPGKTFPKFKDYIPFNTKKIDAILASQVVLYKTKKMGLMIIKDGEETSGKSNDKYRKWFMENCIIKKIMKIPSGAFTCTGTKTVCIYFIKKEGQMTENIQFLQLSDDGNKITEICHVSMEDMKQNHYSWDPNSYIVDEEMEKMMSKSKCEWKKLGEICEINKKTIKKHPTNYGSDEEKPYKFYTGAANEKFFTDNPDINEPIIIINKTNGSGKSTVKFSDKECSVACQTHILSCVNKDLLYYIYMYLLNNKDQLEKGYIGANHKNLSYDFLENFMVPIIKKEIIDTNLIIFNDLAEQKQLLSARKSGIERQMKYYLETQIKILANNDHCQWEKLGNLFELKNGNFNSNQMDNEGDVPFYSCISNNPAGVCSKYNMDYEKYLLLVSAGGSQKNLCGDNVGLGKCYIVSGKTACRTNVYALIQKEKNNNIKYTYFYLNIFRNLTNLKAKFTTNLGVIGKDDINNLNIPLLTSEIQTEIVQYLDKLEAKKNSIDEEISDINNLMKQVLEQSYN